MRQIVGFRLPGIPNLKLGCGNSLTIVAGLDVDRFHHSTVVGVVVPTGYSRKVGVACGEPSIWRYVYGYFGRLIGRERIYLEP